MKKKNLIYFTILLSIIAVFIVINIGISNRNERLRKEFHGEKEFLRTCDCAPIFNANPIGTKYTISFELMAEKNGVISVYQQNGSTHRYAFKKYKYDIEATTEYKKYDIVVEPVLYNDKEAESYLSFYGVYETGIIPHVKNIAIEKYDGE
ncbi:MAG: hypothetical protein MJ131_06060 [Lachnospiraceae bacterium]|nr:hypothetical protein [Lachnospiraceae bacterium]